MTLALRLLDATAAVVARLLCRVSSEAEFAKVPLKGPFILITNHVNNLEIPVLRSGLRPRDVRALSKAESWNHPILRRMLDIWGAIPVRRGETDIGALRQSLDVLKGGGILAIAPEGTRSRDGRLQRGNQGITTIALKSAAPILPLAFHGGEKVRDNVRRLRRTSFHVRVGVPFTLVAGDERPTREIRERMTDEIMYQLAALLPPAYRGVYADLAAATERYLRFEDQAGSNVPGAA